MFLEIVLLIKTFVFLCVCLKEALHCFRGKKVEETLRGNCSAHVSRWRLGKAVFRAPDRDKKRRIKAPEIS